MEALILLDTTELLCVMPRKLHAGWAELCGTKVRMPPPVAEELAPAGVLRSRTTALSVAEELLQPDAPALDDARRQQLERQAWWAAMWRDPGVAVREAGAHHRAAGVAHDAADQLLPRECYIRLNAWAVDNGARFGFKPEPVVFQADDQLVRWTRTTAAVERWIQAGMLASWPARDDASAEQVIRATVKNIGTLVSTGGPLPTASARLLNELENTRIRSPWSSGRAAGFPSPTITPDRIHPSYPDAA